MRTPNSLTWIHISDLHFGHGKEAEKRFDQAAVTQAIVRDAALVAEELGAPDYIFITGDIAFSAKEKEYEAAGKWLDALLGALKLGRDRVLLVPGNHDANRSKAYERLSKSSYAGYRAHPSLINEALEKTSDMEALWPRLTDYASFASRFGGPRIDSTSPFWTSSPPNDLGNIVAIGLNTTLLCFDDTDSPQTLAVGLGQIARALDKESPEALHLVLQHHPPEWLVDGNDLRGYLRQRPHILFCGHVHKQGGFVHLPFMSLGGIELVAGAGHKEAGETGQHAYAWGRLHRDGLDYLPRGWSEQNKRFLAQRIDVPEDQKGWTAKLGEYVKVPRSKLPESLAQWLTQSARHTSAVRSTDTISGPTFFTGAAPFVAAPTPAVPTQPVGAKYDPSKAHFYVPYGAKGSQVVGRADALLKVREQLERGRRTVIGQTAAFVGFGGLGKTQLAVEYAHAYRSSYRAGVYWLNADEDLNAQLARLAESAEWVSPASDARTKLDIAVKQIRTRSECLIIFDNVEDFVRIEPLLPLAPATPHILITSRTQRAGFDAVPIEQLNEAQSLEMLRVESARSLDAPEESEAAVIIARQIEGLPLALELVGGYLRRYPAVSCATYAELLSREGLNARGLQDRAFKSHSFTNHDANLRAALQIDDAIFRDFPLLREVVDLFAWSGAASMGSTLVAALLGIEDGATLEIALGEAESLKILKREQVGAERRFQMHRLVRDVRRQEVPLVDNPARWLLVAERVGDWFEQLRTEFSKLALFEAEIDHLETWCINATSLKNATLETRLLWLRAYPSHHRGHYRQSEQIIQSAMELFERARLTNQILDAHLQNDYGFVLFSLGIFERALEHQKKALTIRLAVLGENHRDTAISLGNVGSVVREMGNTSIALDYQQRALAILAGTFGKTDPQTAMAFNGIGVTLHKMGKHQSALEHHKSALEMQLEVFGEGHPDTATSFDNIGSLLASKGDYRLAIDHQQKALAINLAVLGETHPRTATSFYGVGMSLSALGNYQSALKHQQKALAARCAVLGETHPDTLLSRMSVARQMIKMKKGIQALPIIDTGLKACPDHLELRRIRDELLGNKMTRQTKNSPAKTSTNRPQTGKAKKR